MPNTLPSRQRPETHPPADSQSYFEAAIAGALAADSAWFAHNPGRAYRARAASPAEVTLVRAVEHRLLTPSPGCVVIVLIHRVDESRRRRVLVESFGFDIEAMGEAEVAEMFADVTGSGRTSIAGRRG